MGKTKTIKYASGLEINRDYDDEQEVWELQNKALSTVKFTLDISNCDNVFFQNDRNAREMTVKVGSKQTNSALKIVKEIPWSLSVKFSYSEEALSLEEQKQALEQEKEDWDNQIEK